MVDFEPSAELLDAASDVLDGAQHVPASEILEELIRLEEGFAPFAVSPVGKATLQELREAIHEIGTAEAALYSQARDDTLVLRQELSR